MGRAALRRATRGPSIRPTFITTDTVPMRIATFATTLLFLTTSALAEPAKRIITLSPHAAELVFAIGAGDRLVGVISHSDYPQQASEIEVIGNHTSINIERILALDPDLVITWPTGNRSVDLHQLEAMGLTLLPSSPSSDFRQLADTLMKLGEATGLEQQAKAVADDYLAGLERLEQEYGGLEPVPVFYQLWNAPLMSVGQDDWIQAQIEFCGGENLFADSPMPYPQVNLEQVILRQPQVIVYPDSQAGVPEQWQQWIETPAVRFDRLVPIQADLNHRFSPRLIQGLEQLCKAIDLGRQSPLSNRPED